MKKIKYILVLISILTLVYLNRRIHFLSHFGNFNSLEIQTNNVLDDKFLKLTLFTEGNPPAIIYDRGQINKIPQEYGPNKLFLTYKDSASCLLTHWKYNCNHDHLYKLIFNKSGDDIFCTFDIRGEDGLTKTLKLSRN